MKKIINGKKYDTSTAKEICVNTNNLPYNDFRWLCETLYQKENGEFFLYGEGGAMTRYSVSNGKETSGGSAILPYSIEEAKEFVSDYGTVEEYESLFGEVTE